MRIRFWGTRGSIPTPGPTTVRYGGNTACVEVRSDAGTIVVIDCGTGARPLGQALVAERARRGTPLAGSILIGHTHWDHIHGLPFFAPLFEPEGRWSLYGPRGLGESLADTLAGQMQYTYFPVALEQLSANVTYHDLVEGEFEIEEIRVTTQYLNHPALTLGYRLEVDGSVVVYASDHEPHERSLAHGGDLGSSPEDARHVEFLSGADVVIHDAQYLASEYATRVGWGHSTVEYALDAARLAGVGHLVLHHHEPTRTDEALEQVVGDVRTRARRTGFTGIVSAACEGEVIDLGVRTASASARAAARSARRQPAVEDLAATVLLVVRDPDVTPTIRHAVEAEALALRSPEDTAADGDPVVVVFDSDDGVPVLPAGHVGVLGLTRTFPAQECDVPVTDWLVWPCTVAHARTKLRAAVLRRAVRWQAAPLPSDEAERLAALRGLGLLDTPPEERFDRLTRLACDALGVPIALVTFVDADRQWFKSRQGSDQTESARDLSVCAHAILGDGVFHIPDLLLDDRFAENPAVTGDDRVRSYAGVPLALPDGSKIGTLCVADRRPRLFDEQQLDELRRIAALVERELLTRG